MGKKYVSPFMRQVDALRREAPEGALLGVEVARDDGFIFYGKDAAIAISIVRGVVCDARCIIAFKVRRDEIVAACEMMARSGETVCIAEIVEEVANGELPRREIVRTYKPKQEDGE